MKNFILMLALAVSAGVPLAVHAAPAPQTNAQMQIANGTRTCVDWAGGVCDSLR
jgi:hypothetical protein